jgi:hypothetical protein
MREGKHVVPGGTRGEGMVFFYRYNVPGGTKKNEYFFEALTHFYTPAAGIAGYTSDNHHKYFICFFDK